MTYKAKWTNPPHFGTSTGQKAPPLITTNAVQEIQRTLRANPQIDGIKISHKDRSKPAAMENAEGTATSSTGAATSEITDMCTYCGQRVSVISCP